MLIVHVYVQIYIHTCTCTINVNTNPTSWAVHILYYGPSCYSMSIHVGHHKNCHVFVCISSHVLPHVQCIYTCTFMYVHVHVHVHAYGDFPHAGVMGVGKEKALQFIRACKSHTPSRDALDCFQQWRKGSVCEGTETLSLDMHVYLFVYLCTLYTC